MPCSISFCFCLQRLQCWLKWDYTVVTGEVLHHPLRFDTRYCIFLLANCKTIIIQKNDNNNTVKSRISTFGDIWKSGLQCLQEVKITTFSNINYTFLSTHKWKGKINLHCINTQYLILEKQINQVLMRKELVNDKCNRVKHMWFWSVPDEIQVPAECLAELKFLWKVIFI